METQTKGIPETKLAILPMRPKEKKEPHRKKTKPRGSKGDSNA
ncbi:hypothetical protein NC653_031152 [Populus alba x Populus x berolinensis]|uniref:Uncharacterized protein n=1 Tax=Populus alba x Populus x berolinensis TaxID=444605 RepID=A0AAD6M0K2_9ROSI|nr:hypothetical protein NC653_031152 [Populus alba x Populus x berolinensis]